MDTTFPGATTLALTGVLLAGCSGGGDSDDSGSQDPSNDADAIGSVTPAEGATGVDRSASVDVTFSEDVYAQSVGPVSLTLASDTLVNGQVDFDAGNNRLRFQPDQSLDMRVDYTATVSTTLTDLNGEPLLDSAHAWSFTTEDGAWQAVNTIDDPNAGSSSTVSVAVNASGKAIAAWHQDTGSDYSIYTAWFDPELGQWQDATLVETDTGNAESASVALNDDGDVVVAWRQWGGSAYDLKGNYYDSSTASWSGATTLDGDSGQVQRARTAIDADGKAVVIWSQGGLLHNTYEPGTGWGSAQAIVDGASVRRHTLVVDANGRFTAVWPQFVNSASRYDLYVSRWVDQTGWQTPETLESLDAGDADHPSLAVDGSGNVLVVWQQNDGTVDNIHARRFEIDTAEWSASVLLEQDTQYSAQLPHVHANDPGQAIAVWSQFDGSRTGIHAAHFTRESGWQTSAEINPDGGDYSSDPLVVLDDHGNAWAAWGQSQGTDRPLSASRGSVGGDWQTPETVDTDTGNVTSPVIGLSGRGETLLVWRQSGTQARWFQ